MTPLPLPVQSHTSRWQLGAERDKDRCSMIEASLKDELFELATTGALTIHEGNWHPCGSNRNGNSVSPATS